MDLDAVRLIAGVLDWTWSGASDELCNGEPWQMYRQLQNSEDTAREYPPVSCAQLDPVGFIASYFSVAKRQYCTQECPGMWPEARWGEGSIDAAILPARQYGPLAGQRKATLDLRRAFFFDSLYTI